MTSITTRTAICSWAIWKFASSNAEVTPAELQPVMRLQELLFLLLFLCLGWVTRQEEDNEVEPDGKVRKVRVVRKKVRKGKQQQEGEGGGIEDLYSQLDGVELVGEEAERSGILYNRLHEKGGRGGEGGEVAGASCR